ncbi:putative membrane protein [Halobacteroides halobius DSM 5150]|uniref:Putative membrane protein n=1 Tax=Halobacteroides halobius (strain ATCC 35273 / DSM 5150 / MD-1) TaxID=748449 RepID=L0K7T2_HALHC|nr:AzlD domain-containing protein [Halobacteroides halobius]AGB41086.1 putative membrane protein [Halobacteroides halobius DSM 5150]
MSYLILLIVAMGIVTYLPRMIPLALLKNIKLPPFLKRVLEFIPFAALSALIFPGILNSTNSQTSAIVGGLISVLLALFEVHLLLIVGGGILGVYLWQII